jgi:predicted peptidase
LLVAGKNGFTALHLSAENDHFEAADLPLKGRVDMAAVDLKARTPFWLHEKYF